MKSLLIAAGALAALGVAAPVLADDANLNFSGYGTLGLDDINGDHANTAAVTGRLGARFGPYVGVEGEASGGFTSGGTDLNGAHADISTRDQYAAYAVGFVPVMSDADLFARIGYGARDVHVSEPATSFTVNAPSWNIGGGGQYFFDPKDGVRAEYTRWNADERDLNANVWSLAYVRKF
jgi:hypothetical protein